VKNMTVRRELVARTDKMGQRRTKITAGHPLE